LQDSGAGVWIMPDAHLSLGMVLLHAVLVVFETIVRVILSRSLETETLATAQLRVDDAAERAQLALLAEALERRESRAFVNRAKPGGSPTRPNPSYTAASTARAREATFSPVNPKCL
jgi:hypothetical protein